MFYQKYIVVKHAFVFIKHSAVTHAVIMYPLFTFTFCLFYYGMQNLYYAKCFYIYGVILVPSYCMYLCLPLDIMRKCGLCCRPVSIRLSVCHVRVLYPHQ